MKVIDLNKFYGENSGLNYEDFYHYCTLTPWKEDKFLFLITIYTRPSTNLNFFQLFYIDDDLNPLILKNRKDKFGKGDFEVWLAKDRNNPKEIYLFKEKFESGISLKYSLPDLQRHKEKIDEESTRSKNYYSKDDTVIFTSESLPNNNLVKLFFRDLNLQQNDLAISKTNGQGSVSTKVMKICGEDSRIVRCCISNDGLKAAILVSNVSDSGSIILIDLE